MTCTRLGKRKRNPFSDTDRLRLPEPMTDTLRTGFKDCVRARRGELAEYLVSDALAVLGWTVFRPLSGNPKIDLLALKPEKVLRIQVKTTTGDRVNLRVGRRHRNWTTIRDDVDFLIIVITRDQTLASMFDSHYYIIPSRHIAACRTLRLMQYAPFCDQWDALDRFETLVEVRVIGSELESEYAKYVASNDIILEVSRHGEKAEIIVANIAEAKKDWYDKFGEVVFIHYLCRTLAEATIHGLIHVCVKTGHLPDEPVRLMAKRLAWESL